MYLDQTFEITANNLFERCETDCQRAFLVGLIAVWPQGTKLYFHWRDSQFAEFMGSDGLMDEVPKPRGDWTHAIVWPQHPVGDHVVDFAVEVSANVLHTSSPNHDDWKVESVSLNSAIDVEPEPDLNRDADLRRAGYVVHEVSERDIWFDPIGTALRVWKALDMEIARRAHEVEERGKASTQGPLN